LGLGIKVNFDADGRSLSVVSLPGGTRTPAPVVAPDPGADPTAANLPVITTTMNAIRGHLNTAEGYYNGKGMSGGGLHIGADSPFVAKLPPESQAVGPPSADDGRSARRWARPLHDVPACWLRLENAKANKAVRPPAGARRTSRA
jgi:hypothetical protein